MKKQSNAKRSALLGLLLSLAAMVAATLAIAPAQAAGVPAWDVRATWGDTHLPPGGGGLDPGSLRRISGVTGTLYGYLTFTGTPAQPAGVAVNPVNGDVYAIDVTSFATGGATLRTYDAAGAETAAPCALEWAPGTPLPQPGVDAAGNLYYPNTQTGAVQKLGSGCTPVTLAHPIVGLTDPNSVALDSAGNIYVVDGTTDGSNIASGRLQKFAPDGTLIKTLQSGQVTAVALDKPTGNVYVGRGWGQSFHIQRYNPNGALLKDFGAGTFVSRSPSNYAHAQLELIYNQLAVDETDKAVYAPSLGEVEVFKPLGIGYTLAEPLLTGALSASVAVNQASEDVYAASVGSLKNLGQFTVQPRSVGTEATQHALTITDELPEGVTATHIEWREQGLSTEIYLSGEYQRTSARRWDFNQFCSGVGTETVTCVLPEKVERSSFGGALVEKAYPVKDESTFRPIPEDPMMQPIYIDVEVDQNAAGTGTNVARVEGGDMAQPFSDEDTVPFSNTPSPFGVVPGSFGADVFGAAYPFGQPSRQAGDHPFEQRVDFELNQSSFPGEDGTRVTESNAAARDVEVTLPRGLIGNPQALPKCDPLDFATTGASGGTACPADTQVGYINISAGASNGGYGQGGFLTLPNGLLAHIPLYNLVPPKGTPVDLAFNAHGYVIAHIFAALDPAQNYAIKSVSPNISDFFLINPRAAEVTLWGVPGDPAHDKFRYYPEEQLIGGEKVSTGAPWSSAPIRPFFTNPMDCGAGNGGSLIRADSYPHPGEYTAAQEYPDPLNVTGCEDARFRFGPDIALQPTDRHAGAPTGLDVHLEVKQRNDEVDNAEELYATESDGTLKKEGSVKAIATPPLKKAVVTFPEGMTINPSAAQGLGSCTPAQIGLESTSPIRFNAAPVGCPDSSQYGTLTLHTPLLPENNPPKGYVYIAKQNDNPYGNFLSLYLVIEEPERGILIKVPGRVDLNPETGQITTSFDDLPQFPVSDMQMSLKGGLRAGLVNPQTCGTKTITAEFFSWQDPSTPHVVKDSYEVTQDADGSPCHASLAERPFDPTLTGGTLNPLAGSFSPLELRMTRTDEDQELSVAEGSAPPGLTASLRGISRCSEAQIKAAEAPGRSGTEETEHPSCPPSSQVGTVDAGAGVGQVLTYVKGRVYLAGPYEGAPVSGVAIVPAVAGPFDLGTIVTRAPAYVNPETAQISLKTDPLPQIFKGVPVRVRDIRVHLDRPDFTLNPTNCEAMSLNGTLFSSEGKSKQASNRFQAADCASLGFKPKLSLKLRGGTKRGGHPALTATLKARAGDANIAGAQVTLPSSEFLDQGHLNNICTRVQFKANECPAASIYGHAVARTPLFDTPLEGPVYLRSNPAHKLPDLVAAIKGPASLPVEVDLVGRVDSAITRRPNGEKVAGIRNSFEVVPDAPVTEFTLQMQGGDKGLLENSPPGSDKSLCESTNRATAKFTAQNGRRITLHPKLRATSCKGKGRKGGRGGHRAKHRRR